MTDYILENNKLELEHYNSALTRWKPGFEAAIRFGEMAIKSLLILNGGSALALIAFLGQMSSSSSSQTTTAALFFWPLLCFGVGAAFSTLSAMMAYVAQITYVESEYHKLGNSLRYMTIIISVLAWLFFVGGFSTALYFLT